MQGTSRNARNSYRLSKLISPKTAKAEPPARGVSPTHVMGLAILKVAFKLLVFVSPHLVRSKKVNTFTNSPKIPDVRLFSRSTKGIGG
jgi:hypothetical protein